MSIRDSKWDKEPTSEKLADAKAELEKDIARWNEIYKNGCNDPFWSDGVNLSLKRNHIIDDLRRIYELESKPRQISLFEQDEVGGTSSDPSAFMNDKRIPPIVPMDYMANDRIIRRSK